MPHYEITKVKDRTPADFKDQTPVYRCHLDYYDPVQNNNKFWYVEVFAPTDSTSGYHIVRRWGRNGTNGQSMIERASAQYGALDYAEKLADKKKAEGYKPDPSLLVKIAREVKDGD